MKNIIEELNKKYSTEELRELFIQCATNDYLRIVLMELQEIKSLLNEKACLFTYNNENSL